VALADSNLAVLDDRLRRLRKEPAMAAVLAAAGNPVYLVGGPVRDLILGRKIEDLDLVVAGDLDETAGKAADKLGVRVIPLGEKPKRVYRLCPPGLTVDLCPPEGRTIEADLLRRDLTINAMAIELTGAAGRSWIIDPCRGLADLIQGKVRFVSEANILADPLRLLRLFRFAATLDLRPTADSLALTAKHARLIERPAGERVRFELLKLLEAPRSCPTVEAMLEHGLLEALFPELTPLRGCGQGPYHHLDVLDHTLTALKALEDILAEPERDFPVWAEKIRAYLAWNFHPALIKLAILLHDLGKPAVRTVGDDGQVHFFGHEKAGLEQFEGIAERLRLSAAESGMIRLLIKHHLRPFHLMEAKQAGQLTSKGVFRLARDIGPHLWGLVLHALADAEATLGPFQEQRGGPAAVREFLNLLIEEITDQQDELEKTPPLLNGRDLMTAFNLKPSPLIGRILQALQEAQAVGQIRDRAEALDLAEEILSQEDSEG